MKTRLLILISIGFVLILSVGIYWQSQVDHKFSFPFGEPRFEGEPLSYWLKNLYHYGYGGRRENSTAKDAILQSGPKALPLLLDWIARPFDSGPGIQYQQHAVEGFEILGPVAKPAVPKLIKMIGQHNGYPERALVFIGKEAVPPLTDKLLETLADKREPVMNWRDSHYKNNFFHVQLGIIHILGAMGTNAEAAIPAVRKALYANHGWGWQEGGDPYATLVSIGRNHPEIVIPALIDVLTNTTAPVFNRGATAQAMSLQLRQCFHACFD